MSWMEGLHAFNSNLSMLSVNQITSFLSLAKECEDNAKDGNEANWEEELWEKVGLSVPKFEKMGIKDFLEMFQQANENAIIQPQLAHPIQSNSYRTLNLPSSTLTT